LTIQQETMAMATKIICIKGHPETGREGTKKMLINESRILTTLQCQRFCLFFTIRHYFSFFIEQILREVLRNNVFT
jgi:hypothetical protein